MERALKTRILGFNVNIVLGIISLFFLHTSIHAQHEPNDWYFGNDIGLNFTASPPQVISGSNMRSFEGVATIGTSDGSVLFYANGEDIYGPGNTIIKNGDDFNRGLSSNQGVIFVPIPGNSEKYYVFHIDQKENSNPSIPNPPRGFSYSCIEFINNEWEVTNKNTPLLSNAYENLTAVKACGEDVYWVISHEWDGDGFYAYKIDSTGLDVNPVISRIGRLYEGESKSNPIIPSPNGSRLAVLNRIDTTINIFDFDASTGIISNEIILPGMDLAMSLEFSTYGSKLYTIGKQFDLTLDNPTDIVANAVEIFPVENFKIYTYFLGPDGKVYIINWTPLGNTLSVINDPEENGLSCNFQEDILSFDDKQSLIVGFHQLKHLVNFCDPKVEIIKPEFCEHDSATFDIEYNMKPERVKWFVKQDDLKIDSSTSLSPVFWFDVSGVYDIELQYETYLGWDTLFCTVEAHPYPIYPLLGNDTTLCKNNYLYQESNVLADHYLWSTSDTTANTTLIKKDTVLWLKASNHICTTHDSISVTWLDISSPKIPQDTIACNHAKVLVDIYIDDGIASWMDGYPATSRMLEEGTYLYKTVNDAGCTFNGIIEVANFNEENIYLPNDFELCDGDVDQISFTGSGNHFLWSTGSTSDKLDISEAGVYWGVSTYQGCSVRDSITVYTPSLNLTDHVTLCSGEEHYVDATIEQSKASYLWNDGDTNSNRTLTEGNHSINILTNAGCALHGEILVEVLDLPNADLGEDITICEGEIIPLIYEGEKSYTWSTGEKEETIYIDLAWTYWLQVNDTCGNTSIDSIQVETKFCDLHIPVIFTPNGDLINDLWGIDIPPTITNFEIQVFNRWGSLVFESNGTNVQWDGTFNGIDAPDGTYYYICYFDHPTRSRNGHVTIIR